MEYSLMHKNIMVANLDLDNETGHILKIEKIFNAKHFPVGIVDKNGIADRAALNDWWVDRSIPASRSGVKKALEVLNISNSKLLLTKCFGLSLSDQYWIKPQNEDISWETVNFFDNEFSEDIGDVLWGKQLNKDDVNYHSPDNTSDGCLKKRWKIVNGKHCLLKSGSTPFMQQPFNEVIASIIMDRLNIPHVPYSVVFDEDGQPYSICEDFITGNTELVSAWRVMQANKKRSDVSVYQHYINCCELYGIKNIVQAIDQMIVVDYIIANEDRHQNNFGLVRDANTLEWLYPAPIYDSGSSLGYDKLTNQILSGKTIECKPFKKTHEEQLNLVTSFDWINVEALKGLDKDIKKVFANASEYIDENRINAIVSSVESRIEYLQGMAMPNRQTVDNINDDVDEDIAEDYTFSM